MPTFIAFGLTIMALAAVALVMVTAMITLILQDFREDMRREEAKLTGFRWAEKE